ncbi:S-layer homology domain-containing protein [Paenibacillus agricola]|uniref:SLH domain-containing protein n=1 Tax=Paenibacillus agricola TaxID=2716264 RepID=A0ABX0JI30_9BACL|nr:S-layer homology domain-containing protein [Paenibacillus agricola]NHN34348.1 hypothetical protein [Paenibacillus agricola]
MRQKKKFLLSAISLSLLFISAISPAYGSTAGNPSGSVTVALSTDVSSGLSDPTSLPFFTKVIGLANYLKNDAGLTVTQKDQIRNMQIVFNATYRAEVQNIFLKYIDLTDVSDPVLKQKLMTNKTNIINTLIDLTTVMFSVDGLATAVQSLAGKLQNLSDYGVDPIDLVNFAAAVFDGLDASNLTEAGMIGQVNDAISNVPSGSSLVKYGITATELNNAITKSIEYLDGHAGAEFKASESLVKSKFVIYLNRGTTPVAPAIVGGNNLFTTDTTPDITVTAEANSTIKIYEGTTLLGSGVVAASGSITITLSALSFGNHNLTVTATDSAGNVSEAASLTVWINIASSGGGGNGGGGGGGGGSTGSNTDSNTDSNTGISISGQQVNFGNNDVKNETRPDGTTVTTVTVPETILKQAFDSLKNNPASAQVVTIDAGKSDNAIVSIPASAIVEATNSLSDAIVSIKGKDVTYDLPIKALDMASVLRELGADASQAKIVVKMEKASKETANKIAEKARLNNVTLLSDPIDFSITVEANGKSVTISSFGSNYVSRTIVVAQTVDSSEASAVYVDESSEMHFVPAVFIAADGKTQVTVKRNSNSTYAIVKSIKSFSDVSSHWAKTDVNLLASKLIINGLTDSTFGPDENITRAQFAALVVRSLGLVEEKGSSKFSDVKSADWFAGAVGSAVKYSIVDGFEDGTFRANANITREQMAVMVTRALKVAGKTVDVSTKQEQLLKGFSDNESINSWAKASVAQAVEVKIIEGMSANTFVPADNATRAQAAVMLKRLLKFVQFIN